MSSLCITGQRCPNDTGSPIFSHAVDDPVEESPIIMAALFDTPSFITSTRTICSCWRHPAVLLDWRAAGVQHHGRSGEISAASNSQACWSGETSLVVFAQNRIEYLTE